MSRKSFPWLFTALSIGLIALAALPAGAPRTASATLSRPAGAAVHHAATQPGYGQVPLAFEMNEGQTSGAVRFLAHGNGYTLFLTPGQAVLSLQQGTAPDSGKTGLDPITGTGGTIQASALAQTLGMRWLGANPNPVVTGENPLPGTVNYFIGNDPAQWHTHIPTFQQARYHDIYPGVDLVYYGTHGQLEYDFVVAPGADPSRIALGFSGAAQMGVDLAGNLSLTLPGGTLQQDQPAIYQNVNGARTAVLGGFILTANRQVGFALGAYNPHLPLVIDPAYKFSTYLGGSDGGNANSIAVDSAGDAYVAGSTYSVNFPTANPAQSANAGNTDGFVTKFNAAGTSLIYSTYIGGSQIDQVTGITLDSSGDAYIAGYTSSSNYPTLNAFQSTLKAYQNAFVTKFTADGSGLFYSTYLGGSYPGYESAAGIAVDSGGEAYVTGSTTSTDFPTLHAIQATNAGSNDVFVTKFNAAGNGLIYSTYLGGSGDDYGNAIALDSSGNAYITGYSRSANFPTTAGAFQTHLATNAVADAVVAKLSADGTALTYATYLGGDNGYVASPMHAGQPTHTPHHSIQGIGLSSCGNCNTDSGNSIAVDASGSAYITGETTSPNFPVTSGAFQTTIGTAGDSGFVTKLNASGSTLAYSTFLTGSGGAIAYGIALDYASNSYIVGFTKSTNFPTVNPLQGALGSAIYGDAFVSELNASGSALLYSSYLGGSTGYGTTGDSIAIDLGRDVYVAGYTSATNFPTKNAFQGTFTGGNSDAFVTKLRLWPSVDTTTGVFRPSNGVLYLKNANTTGPADITLNYGQPGDQPITGDWNGKGYKSIGIYRNATFYLRNSNTTGYADITAAFGASGDLPIAGDWTGKGYDSIGVYRPSTSTFYLRDSNTTGAPDHTVTLGVSRDVPIVGDWTGKGYDSVGVFRPSNGIVYLRNSNTTGYADIAFTYGIAGDKPVVGDWNADGVDTLGVDRAGHFLLRNSNTTGPADLSFYLGAASDQPIAGPWLAPPGSLPPPRGAPTPARAPTAMQSLSAAADRPRHAS